MVEHRHAQSVSLSDPRRFMPQAIIRVDASTDIGTGHVMRCLTLAQALKRHEVSVSFVCADLPGNKNALIQASGFRVAVISPTTDWAQDAAQTQSHLKTTQPDWLVVDHYGLDASWQQAVRANVKRLMVIDDLDNRTHHCDLLLDQSLDRNRHAYATTQAMGADVLLGPHYALLRDEFAALRAQAMQRRVQPRLERLMLSMGGVDAQNFTTDALNALHMAGWHERVDMVVILGANAPHRAEVAQTVQRMGARVRLLENVTDMAHLMAQCDVAIGAPGTSSWERCCMGLPTVLVIQADNQRHNAQSLVQHQAAVLVAQANLVVKGLEQVAMQLKTFSDAAASLIDGGGAQRVVAAMLKARP